MTNELMRALYEAGAVHCRKAREPQTGHFLIPVYFDIRVLLGMPTHRALAAQGLASLVREAYPTTEALLGIATGGIPYALLTAGQMSLPMGYVRPRAKAHGMARQIEGTEVHGKAVVLMDDLVSSGSSVCAATRALREAGALVLGAISVFSYDFSETGTRLSEEGIQLRALMGMEELMRVGEEGGWLSPAMSAHIRLYAGNPRAEMWAKA